MAGISKQGPLEKQLLPLADKLLTTKPFIVLKERNQLGFMDRIMPEWGRPAHTRFDHTVGVMAKCIVAADQINKNTSDNNSDMRLELLDVAELVAAAALHDCGHLPYSHVTERAILAHHGNRYGARHEERIVPMLKNGHDYFDEYLVVLRGWPLWRDDDKFRNSLFRITYLLHPATALQQLDNKDNREYKRPKMAIEQILTSELDMDRLDYLIRDSENLNYKPVLSLTPQMAKIINGMFLHKAQSVGDLLPEDNLEICIKEQYLEKVFFMLVGRVLLYKFRYFNKEVRRFEGALTYLVSELLGQDASIQTIELMQLGDKEFLDRMLARIIEKTFFEKADVKNKLSSLLKNIQDSNSNRYEYVGSIVRDKIENPRLKEEFTQKAGSFKYIKQLQKWLSESVKVDKDCLLLDVFRLTPGNGAFLVRPDVEDDKLRLLKDYMNGSNLHRLCSQLSLDVYIHTEQSQITKLALKNKIESFGKFNKED